MSAVNYFGGETPDNYEQKCLCMLVLDVSGSMDGDPIMELNRGLQTFQREVMQDYVASNRLEVSVITFSSNIQVITPPALITDLQMPHLRAEGSTRLADAMRIAMEGVEIRKRWYRDTGQTYYRPFIVLITDGEADPGQDMQGLKYDIRDAVDAKKFVFYALGVQGANMEKLAEICPPNFPPQKLAGLKFSEFFRWLSNSISIISKSREGDRPSLPPTSGWSQLEV